MKKQLRKIVVDGLEYVYTVKDQYQSITKTNTLTVRIFLNGKKQTPLIVKFHTIDDYYMGQLLKSGIELNNHTTNSPELVNINRPKFIQQLIVQGQKEGWKGTNRVGIQDGLLYLNRLGYETSPLHP